MWLMSGLGSPDANRLLDDGQIPAVGAGGGQTCGEDLGDVLDRPALPAAGARAEGRAAFLVHLAQLQPGPRAEHGARLADHAVVARQVARVVQRDAALA